MIFHCSAEFTIVQERRMCYTEIPCGHSGISRGAEPGCWHLSEEFTTLFSARSPPKNKICACDGIGRHARFRFSCSNACGFESLQAHHVGASSISLAPTFFKSQSALMPLLLLFNRDSLRWIRGWFWVRTEKLEDQKCSHFPSPEQW